MKGNCQKKHLTTCERKISSYKPAFKKHLSNICDSIREKVKQHWGWVEKKALHIKKPVIHQKKKKKMKTRLFLKIRTF